MVMWEHFYLSLRANTICPITGTVIYEHRALLFLWETVAKRLSSRVLPSLCMTTFRGFSTVIGVCWCVWWPWRFRFPRNSNSNTFSVFLSSVGINSFISFGFEELPPKTANHNGKIPFTPVTRVLCITKSQSLPCSMIWTRCLQLIQLAIICKSTIKNGSLAGKKLIKVKQTFWVNFANHRIGKVYTDKSPLCLQNQLYVNHIIRVMVYF